MQTRRIGSLEVSVVGLGANDLDTAFFQVAGASRPGQVRANLAAASWQPRPEDCAGVAAIVAGDEA